MDDEKQPPLGAEAAEQTLRNIETCMDKQLSLYKAAPSQTLATIHHAVYKSHVNRLKLLTNRCVYRMKQLEMEARQLELQGSQLKKEAMLFKMNVQDMTHPRHLSAQERLLYFMLIFHAKSGLKKEWGILESELEQLKPEPRDSDWREKAYYGSLNSVLTYYYREHNREYSRVTRKEATYYPYLNNGASFHRLIRAATSHMKEYGWSYETLDREIRHTWSDFADRFHNILETTGILCLLRIRSV